MTFRIPMALGALAASTMLGTAPAAAQVNGIATADTAVAVARTQALQTGFQQISTQYEGQRPALEQAQQSRQTLVQQLDTNTDGQLSETEVSAAPPATVQSIQGLEQQIAQIQGPIQRARVYVVSQIAQQYSAAVQQVISDRSIQILITPEAIVYAPEAADVTEAVAQALNARVPSVQITPPDDFQPTQATVQLFQQIQQLLVLSAMQQQQQQQGAAGQQQQPVEGR